MEDIAKVANLKRQVRFLWLGVLLALTAPFVTGNVVAEPAAHASEHLRVRSISVVDAMGVERVFIGAPVHGPIIDGVEEKRIAGASGILLNGPDGDERGGYLTTETGGEAVFSLDAADGAEVFKVVANPDSGASLFLQHQNGALLALTTYRGAPEQQLYGQDGKRLLAVPADASPLE